MPKIIGNLTERKNILSNNTGKYIRPQILIRLTTIGEGMKKWGLARFGSNDILGAGLAGGASAYYSVRKMNIQQV